MSKRAAIRAIASHLPEQILSNAQLAAEFENWSADDILAKTGIASRHIAAPGECASDLGVAAAKRLFDSGACAPSDIDYVLFCTQSPDYPMPSTACLVQDRLGLRTSVGAIDLNQGCTGFVYALSVAKGLIESHVATNVLLITAETYSRFVNARDRSVRTIFGDAAAATLVSGVESDDELVGPFVFGTDGRGIKDIVVPAGGARHPITVDSYTATEREKGNWRSDANIYMNGPEVFNFTLKAVPRVVDTLLDQIGGDLSSIDYFVFHQANKFMLDRLRAKIGIDEEKFCLELESCGNTVSCTIPIALQRARSDGRLRAGARTMIVSFGVGYSWAAAIIRAH